MACHLDQPFSLCGSFWYIAYYRPDELQCLVKIGVYLANPEFWTCSMALWEDYGCPQWDRMFRFLIQFVLLAQVHSGDFFERQATLSCLESSSWELIRSTCHFPQCQVGIAH